MGITEIIGLSLSIVDKFLDKLPNYEQKKKEKYYKLKRKYNEEITKDYDLRDDNLVIVYRNELLDFLKTFVSEISS